MDTLTVALIGAGMFGSYFLGRFSTQGESWESAAKKLNKTCNDWRTIAQGWEETAHKWQALYDELERAAFGD